MSDDEQGMALTALDEQASESIRKVWHEGHWFFSVIDVVGLLTDSPQPRRYWTDLKRRAADEGFREVYANCVQLKMKASDGKERLTDAADAETILRIIQSIPSPKAEPFKAWMARVGRERLEELENPALAVDRLRQVTSAVATRMSGLTSGSRASSCVMNSLRSGASVAPTRAVSSPS